MGRHRYDTETTRQELLDSGRALFADLGYAAARTEEIVARTGLTRGALYHHFGSKVGLFRAVLEQVHVEVAEKVDKAGRSSTGGPIDALRAGFHGYLDAALDRNVRQILLIDGPAVIGWQAWHDLDLEHGYSVTRTVLEHAMRKGQIEQAPVDELTHLLLGAVTQAALELGRVEDTSLARSRYCDVIDLVLDGLRTD
ncbi:MAG: TetR/AcrR family transcriptional regulator [Acidimicrobiales bacterium]